jgi:hypothetical protein
MSDTPDNDYGLGLKVHEDAYRELEDELAAVTEQRDRLAEALREIEWSNDSQWQANRAKAVLQSLTPNAKP